MAITPIQVRPQERKLSAMEKIALALGITEKVANLGLAVPQFLQQRDIAKQTAGFKKADLDLRTKKLEQDRIIAVAEAEAKANTAAAKAAELDLNKTKTMLEHSLEPAPDQPEAEITFGKEQPSLLQPQGMLEAIQPPQTGLDVTMQPDPEGVDFPGLGRVKKSELGGKAGELSDIDEASLDAYLDDYQLAPPGKQGKFTIQIGGKDFSFVDKPVDENLDDTTKAEQTLRKEFLEQSKKFKEQSEAMARVEASAKDPSAAGDLALIFNYMKILDPGSTVREGEFANAQNSAGVPQRIVAKYNSVRSGERLGQVQRADFLDRAQRLYKEQLEGPGGHAEREKFYRSTATRRKLDPKFVVPNIAYRVAAPTDKDAEDF